MTILTISVCIQKQNNAAFCYGMAAKALQKGFQETATQYQKKAAKHYREASARLMLIIGVE